MARLTNEVARKNLGETRDRLDRICPAGLDEVLSTGGAEASLWMIEFRGELTASMVYDALPMVDHFKKVDDTTLLGVMNGKPEIVMDDGTYFYFLLDKA